MLTALQENTALPIELKNQQIITFFIDGEDSSTGQKIGVLFDIGGDLDIRSTSDSQLLAQRIELYAAERRWSRVLVKLFPAEAAFFSTINWGGRALLRSETIKVRKLICEQMTIPSTREINVRFSKRDDLKVCQSLLKQSLINGMDKAKICAQELKNLGKQAEDILEQVLNAEGSHLVAVIDGQIVGHLVGHLSKVCNKTGIEEAELIDAYAIPGKENLGVAKELTRLWEHQLLQNGIVSCRGSVSGPNRMKILPRLEMSGWRTFAHEWTLELSEN